MKIIDPKLKTKWPNFIFQCFLAITSIGIVLYFLDIIYQGAVVASFGATTFIIFVGPHHKRSCARTIIGSHIIGTAIGIFFYHIYSTEFLKNLFGDGNSDKIILGALAVGLSMFLMAITDTEHPPAAGLALGLVFNGFILNTIVVIFAGVLMLMLIKTILKKYLTNLL